LRFIKKGKLQENSKLIGDYFKGELIKLSKQYNIIGDVRGQGLFLGIEFVDRNMNPLKEETIYIVNRLKKYGILSSVDGPDNNVIKIKPPLTFNKHNCDRFILYLRKILNDDFLNSKYYE
jgi:4-aminobutyrate aminotransferase-like enzyme